MLSEVTKSRLVHAISALVKEFEFNFSMYAGGTKDMYIGYIVYNTYSTYTKHIGIKHNKEDHEEIMKWLHMIVPSVIECNQIDSSVVRAIEKDLAIFDKSATAYSRIVEPVAGDFIIFKNGEEARITHVWRDENGIESIQTSDSPGSGSFYLDSLGHMSYSGGLNGSIPWKYFKLSSERRKGEVWFFHLGIPQAGGAVYAKLSCKVWECSVVNRTYEEL